VPKVLTSMLLLSGTVGKFCLESPTGVLLLSAVMEGFLCRKGSWRAAAPEGYGGNLMPEASQYAGALEGCKKLSCP
jgi:hypothetical protein